MWLIIFSNQLSIIDLVDFYSTNNLNTIKAYLKASLTLFYNSAIIVLYIIKLFFLKYK